MQLSTTVKNIEQSRHKCTLSQPYDQKRLALASTMQHLTKPTSIIQKRNKLSTVHYFGTVSQHNRANITSTTKNIYRNIRPDT